MSLKKFSPHIKDEKNQPQFNIGEKFPHILKARKERGRKGILSPGETS
jgi:hypothetical protein